MDPETKGRKCRFGVFEVDFQENILRKAGVRIRLQDQPFQILVLLLERPGQLVTREEIRQKLWSDNTFVEFDDALNTAVRKLRTALSDSADNPRFLETVPRRGYRFVAPVTPAAGQVSPPTQSESSKVESPPISDPGVLPSSQKVIKTGRRRRSVTVAALVLLAIVAFGAYWYHRRNQFRITAADTIVLADFVNSTGESVFDDAPRQALQVGLQQSPFIKVLSDRTAAVVLKQMGHSPDERMAGRTAIEVCRRTGGKVTVQGSIASLGTTYLVGLAAIRCDSGEPVVNQQVQAKRKEDIIDALGQATAQLRERLGESLPSIQKYNAPLEQATTPSLEALNTYGMALSAWDKKGDRDSLPYFKRAIELDPSFAMAYGALATIYNNLGEQDLARQNASKAYELRNRVTEAERISIEARYHLYVTGDLEEAARVYEFAVDNYPQSAGALNHLGSTYAELGRNEKAVDRLREAMLLDPTRATTYFNLAMSLLALDRIQEAEAVLQEADRRKFRTDFLSQANYALAFLRDDDSEMQRLLQQSSEITGAESLLLSEQADTESYHGRFEKANQLSRVAANLMEHDGDHEAAALCLARTAIREAEVGNAVRAREFIALARKHSQGEDVVTLTALVMAEIGDIESATTLSHKLDHLWPAGTFTQKYWLPLIRSQIDLHRKQWSKALTDLDPAKGLEYADPPSMLAATAYPAYVRGQAYLSAGDGAKAAAEFQKLIDHRGLIQNSVIGALARLGFARACALQSRSAQPASHQDAARAKARSAYSDFLKLWQNADPEIPLLRQAKLEYLHLSH